MARRVAAFGVILLIAACSAQKVAPTQPPPATTLPGNTTSSQPSPTTSDATTAPTTQPRPPLRGLAYEEVAALEFPIHMVPFIPGSELIATKDGRLWLLTDRAVSESPILDITGQVRDQGEQGLLSIAVHPQDSTRVFIHYSANDGDTVVSEFSWDGSGLSGERVLLRLDQPAPNHNGGMLQFGPDGVLYLGLGDGGGADDQFNNGQNPDTLLAGLVAIMVDGEPVSTKYATGLRNPWRFWIDGDPQRPFPSYRIYVADVGQNAFEEVSVAPLEPDLNFGWSITEGFHCFPDLSPVSDCETAGVTLPTIEVSHSDAGTCSITGGVVYRGSEIPEIDGHYFYSDYCGGYLRSFRTVGGQVEVTDWTDQVGTPGNVVSFGTDGAGEMYVLTTEALLKVVPVR